MHAYRRLGYDVSAASFEPHIEHVSVPTLVVQNTNDPMLKREFVQSYYDALRVEKELLWVDAEQSRFAAYEYMENHPEELFYWFDKYL